MIWTKDPASLYPLVSVVNELLLAPMPGRYADWLTHARSFYSAMLSNPAYQQALGAVNVTPDDLARVNEMLPTVVTHK